MVSEVHILLTIILDISYNVRPAFSLQTVVTTNSLLIILIMSTQCLDNFKRIASKFCIIIIIIILLSLSLLSLLLLLLLFYY